MPHSNSRQPVPERVGIYDTGDEKLRALGEVLVNDVSRAMLKLLFEETLTANEIATRTGFSLQLVRYHLRKLQDVGLAEISRIGKNTKAHDMKYYAATRFAIVIVPSKFSEKARSSRSLVRSFKSIYRLGGIGIATVGSWFAAGAAQGLAKVLPSAPGHFKVPNGPGATSYNPFYNAVGGPYSGHGGIGSGATLEEMLKLARERVALVAQQPHAGSGTPFFTSGGPHFFWPLVVALSVLACGISFEVVMRLLRANKAVQGSN